MFSTQTYEAIRQRMLDNITYDIDKREGSFTNNIISPQALELAQAYYAMSDIVNLAFLQNNSYELLDAKVGEWGIVRKENEADEELVKRFYNYIQKPSTSGNINDYYNWSMSVAGVGGCKVLPLASGAGTVNVVVIGTDKKPVTQTIADNAKAYIETVRPIGATVTVVSATSKAININVDVSIASGYTLADVKANIEANITEYLKSVAFEMSYISYARLGNVILDTTGVFDYASFTVNGGTSNIALLDTEVATLGTVTVV